MKRFIPFLFLAIASTLSALVFFGLRHDFILILRKNSDQISHEENKRFVNQKKVPLYIFKGSRWRSQKQEMVWSNDVQTNIVHFLNDWIAYAREELLISVPVFVQSAILTQGGTNLYISFSESPFKKNSSLFEKLALTEMILRTIREQYKQINECYFLINHHPLQDPHLAFQTGFSMNGYNVLPV